MADNGGRLTDIAGMLRAKVDELGGEGAGRILQDTDGPAVYRIGGPEQPITVVGCVRCRHVSLIPSVPLKPVLYWTCPSGHTYRLTPPLDVLRAAYGRPVS